MTDQLSNIKLRHAILSSLHHQMNYYIQSLRRGLFGDLTPEEQAMADTLQEALDEAEALLSRYYAQEELLS